MVENKGSLFGIIALILGASGLGLGAFSVVGLYGGEGLEGPPGQDGLDGTEGINGINGTDGQDGNDAPGGLVVGFLDPDHGEVVSGNITIKALIYGSEDYTVSVLRNGTEIGTTAPMTWDTTTVSDGWWNVTIRATDVSTSGQSQDDAIIYIYNSQLSFFNFSADGDIIQTKAGDQWGELHWIHFNLTFRANLFIYFNCRLSLDAAFYTSMGFSLDDGNIIIVEVLYLGTTATRFNLNCMYTNVAPGPHKVSFYWIPEMFSRTITLENYARLGVIITL